MLHVSCSGRPYEIGQQHGRTAKSRVKGSIAFYEDFFIRTAKFPWSKVTEMALQFLPYLESSWPAYVEEIEGLAEGAGVPFQCILALNVRTEIAYGMAADGCTALSWKTPESSFLAQNWDWDNEQLPNIICIHITQPSKPNIHMMTEAGIIGKIGLNSAGVGVTLNAIQAKGVDFHRLPTHLALRTVLESTSRNDAVKTVTVSGVASSCHITVADAKSGGTGLECSAYDIVQLPMNDAGMCTHSNHFLKPHAVEGRLYLPDSIPRIERIQELLSNNGPEKLSKQYLKGLLRDETNYPLSICRAATEKSSVATLFSIVMDLGNMTATVKMGKPTEDGEEVELKP